jgi:hypothetical protein
MIEKMASHHIGYLASSYRKDVQKISRRCAGALQNGWEAEPMAERGYNTGKRVNGRRRHLSVDALGLVLKALVAEALSRKDGGLHPGYQQAT